MRVKAKSNPKSDIFYDCPINKQTLVLNGLCICPTIAAPLYSALPNYFGSFSGKYFALDRSVYISKPPLLLIFGTQCLSAGLIILLFWLIRGHVAAASAFFGALVFIAPQQYFAYKSFRYMGARAAVKTVQSFYSAESSKLLLVAVGFALVFSFYQEADVFALMVSFIFLVIINGIAPIFLAK